MPGYSSMATAMAVLSVGAIHVIAEVDDTLTLDPEDTEDKITDRTKAIISIRSSLASGGTVVFILA